ncbi:MAG: hypothetical protein ACRC8T_03110, partial [Acidaminococcaceae bacterium]
WKRPGRIDSCRLNKETIPFGMVSLFYVEKYLSEQALGPFAVSCSSGPFHTRQFASKLSVADVYDSRNNKAAHQIKRYSENAHNVVAGHTIRYGFFVLYVMGNICVGKIKNGEENAVLK